MGNLYGVASPLALPAIYTAVGGADVTCTAGSEITVITTGAITALGPGDYYPLIWLYANIAFGGTLPSALTFAFKLGAGSDVDTQAVDLTDCTVSKSWQFAIPLIGANSGSAWIGSGSTINITALSVTQACTFKFATSRAIVALLRGPDA
jgi:hypothetical protein